MKKLLFLLIFSSLILAACAGDEPQSQPAESQSDQPAAQAETPTITPEPPTATPIPDPTDTPVPTEAPQEEEPEAMVEEPEVEEVDEVPDTGQAILEIVNLAEVEICDIAVTPTSAEEFGDNILDDVLLPGDILVLEGVEPDLYDLVAFNCDNELVSERYEVILGDSDVVWEIGSDGEMAAAEDEEAVDELTEETQAAVISDAFQAANCPFDVPGGVVIDCGFLSVPENRTINDSPTIELAVAILRAEGQANPDPIIFLDGGPGSSALVSLSSDFEGWLDYPFHQDHDMIFVDQRGTGYSRPSLNCPEVEEGLDNGEAACRDRLLIEGIDLTAYNTAENASDVADLWQALGYDQVNLFGVSYGTRLGLAIMRDHPVGVRSVVLDSPFPPNIDLPSEEGISNWAAMQELFSACTDDPLCRDSYPDLEAVFINTVARLNNAPADFDGEELYGDDLVNTLVQALYVPDLIDLLPRMIYEVSEDNFDVYDLVSVEASGGASRLPKFQDGEDRSDSEGMYTSVTCHDEYAFGDFYAAEARALEELPEALLDALFYTNAATLFDSCDLWAAGQAAVIENEPVISDIPTLILTGQFDPVTPPRWGEIAAQSLSNAYLFELPGFGHSLSSDPGCPTTLISQFFADPTVAPDSSCINELPPPQFFLPDEPLDF